MYKRQDRGKEPPKEVTPEPEPKPTEPVEEVPESEPEKKDSPLLSLLLIGAVAVSYTHLNQDKAGLQPNEAPACLFFQRGGGGTPGLPVFPWQYREQCRHVPDDRPHAPVLLSGYV